MDTILKTIFLCAVFAGIMKMQMGYDTVQTTNHMMKEALEVAVHDASLLIDEEQLGDGLIVFDRVQASATFKNSLQKNLKLDSSLFPLPNTFLQDKVKILHLEFVDDSSGVSFPNYAYVNPTYNIIDQIDGPAVIAVIETSVPRYFSDKSRTIRRSAVYEYKQ